MLENESVCYKQRERASERPLTIMYRLTLALLLCVVLYVGDAREGETCSQNRRGCKIENGLCQCGYGCFSEYRYNSKSECYKALRGRELDICLRSPCRNGGTCSQISHEPGFKCRCEGTGYYGQRCHNACPKFGIQLSGSFPYECILI